jgi:hypothetical protein
MTPLPLTVTQPNQPRRHNILYHWAFLKKNDSYLDGQKSFLSYSQKPENLPIPKPAEYNPHLHVLFFQDPF